MKKSHTLFFNGITALILTLHASGQTSFTSTSATTAWNAARWNNTTDAAPYTSTFTANNAVSFTSGTYSFAGMGATTNVGNVNVADNVTVNFASISSTYATGGAVRTITVGTGGVFDLNANAFSTAVGTGLIKSGAGVFGTGAGTFSGGFTLNQGTVIARGTTGMGSGGTNVLTLNGGTVASNNTRDFANTRFGGGIVIGGNVQFGELDTIVSIASSTANLSFANNVSLGGANRTLTVGNNGIQTFSGIIANTGSGGVTFDANTGSTGRFDITNAANTFTGNISVTGGEVRFTVDGSMGNATNDIIIDGGRFATASGATFTLGAGRDVFIGDSAGTAISTTGVGSLTINNTIANVSGKTGSWTKLGTGTLELSGSNTYTGSTTIEQGTLALTGTGTLGSGNVILDGGILSITGITASSYTLANTQTLSGSGDINSTAKSLLINGTLAPGASAGVIDVTGNVTLGSVSISNFEIFGDNLGEFDQFNVTDTFTMDGTLNLTTTGTYLPGDFVQLFSATTFAGSFDSITGTDIGGGLAWDTSTLASNGIITVIPEPSVVGLLGLSAAALLRRRKR